ncbi:MAG: hypothetical protein IAE99_10450 [Rhodothermales bacterium]|nr:hypothetical protein [Rhodothermales bacterium]
MTVLLLLFLTLLVVLGYASIWRHYAHAKRVGDAKDEGLALAWGLVLAFPLPLLLGLVVSIAASVFRVDLQLGPPSYDRHAGIGELMLLVPVALLYGGVGRFFVRRTFHPRSPE